MLDPTTAAGGASLGGDGVVLSLTRPAGEQLPTLRRVAAVLDRALRMDDQAMVRTAAVGEGSTGRTDLFVSTPLGCIVSQRIAAVPGGRGKASEAGDLSADGAVVMGSRVLAAVRDALASGDPGDSVTTLDLGSRVDFLWAGSPPPGTGFTVVDTVPGPTVRELYAGMSEEHQEHPGPAGIARSLLEQHLLTLSAEGGDGAGGAGEEVAIEGRVIAAIGALGLAAEPRPGRGGSVPQDLVRVSVTGSWIRVDGLYGSAFAPRPGGLARIPQPR